MSKLVKLLNKSNRELIAENRGLQIQIEGLQAICSELHKQVEVKQRALEFAKVALFYGQCNINNGAPKEGSKLAETVIHLEYAEEVVEKALTIKKK